MRRTDEPATAEQRFRVVFGHLGAVTGYARRRGSPDPEAIAAETMTIAWRRLADVPRDDPRPWLFVTARNLLHAERRQRSRAAASAPQHWAVTAPDPVGVEPRVQSALASLSPGDREALMLVAFDDLTPAMAARVLGINPTAFRVRLYRARRRFLAALDVAGQPARTEMETA
jgi:DNA-directed RNA polymerase specialized sigma24 family protein